MSDDPDVAATDSSAALNTFRHQCDQCDAIFRRAEHLKRHLLTHNSSRPFGCPICNKRFARRDTMHRHEFLHSKERGPRESSRVTQACASCASVRLRCNGQNPCQRCIVKGMQCEYVQRKRRQWLARRSKPSNSITVATTNVPTPPEQPTDEENNDNDFESLTAVSPRLPNPALAIPGLGGDVTEVESTAASPMAPFHFTADSCAAAAPTIEESSAAGMHQVGAHMDHYYESTTSTTAIDQNASSLLELSGPQNHEFNVIDWISPHSTVLEMYGFGSAPFTPVANLMNEPFAALPLQTVETPRSSWPTDDYEIRLAGRYPSRPRANLRDAASKAQLKRDALHGEDTPTSGDISLEFEKRTLRQWPSDWNPTKEDSVVTFPDMRQITLEILETEELRNVKNLNTECYTEISAYLLRYGSVNSHFQAFKNANLPSLRAMDCFVQLYFEYFHPIFPMIHQATFDPSREPWQLVLAVAALGSRYSKMPGAHQFSNALLELLRRAIADTFEQDNSTIRETWICQCIVLHSLGMTYSGNKRYLEIAESKRNSPVTAVRRNGCLLKSANNRRFTMPNPGSGIELEVAWREWVSEEMSRRLGFSAYCADAQIAVHLDLAPCMSAAELHQRLPEHDSLWDALDAETWMERRLALDTETNTPTLPVALQMLTNREQLPSSVGCFARLILVLALYQRTVTVLDCIKNPFLVGLGSQNITQDQIISQATVAMEKIRPQSDVSGDNDTLKVSLECHLTLTLMLLCTRRKDLLKLAHSFTTGIEEEPEVLQGLVDWMNESGGWTSRLAVGYAGLLLTMIRKSCTRGFHEPIAALLAVLVLWLYNRLSDQLSKNGALAEDIFGNYSYERAPILRLDRIKSTADLQCWQDGQKGVRLHLQGVGNMPRTGAATMILEIGRRALLDMDVWALSDGFAAWLTRMRAHT